MSHEQLPLIPGEPGPPEEEPTEYTCPGCSCRPCRCLPEPDVSLEPVVVDEAWLKEWSDAYGLPDECE